MNKVFGFSSGQTKMLLALCLVLVAVSVFRLVKFFSETGPEPLQLVVELSDGNKEYTPTLKVDLNLSPIDSLELVPGIGPVYASRIIAYRDSAGRFENIRDIMNIEGIGLTTYENIKGYLEIRPW